MRVLTFVVLFLLAAPAPGQLQITIAIEPASSLPGISPSVRVIARNNGSTPVEVPLEVALWVMPAAGDGFYAVSGGRTDARTLWLPRQPDEPPITVAPGASRDLTMWAQGNAAPTWFGDDRRLEVSGTYRLKLFVGSDVDDAISHSIRTAPRPAPIVSNEVTYTVLEPAGDDAAAWNLIQKAEDGWPLLLADEIWQSFPNSRYAAYCVPKPASAVDYAAEIANYEAAIEKKPNPPMVDAYRLRIAHCEIGLMHRAMTADSITSALAASDRARLLLTQLARDAIDPDTRREAAEKIRHYVRTREQIQHEIDVRKGVSPKEVIPLLSCLETRADGKKFVWFGFENETRNEIKVPIGAENKITPPPFDRSQPTTFPPGYRNLAFAVAVDTPHLTWHIQKRQFQVKVSEVAPCPANLQELREQEASQK
jgi:hypothetical protein